MKNRITERGQGRGWSQSHLAERPDVSRRTVNALERGRDDPSFSLAFRLAGLFGLPIEPIFQPDEARGRSRRTRRKLSQGAGSAMV